MEAINELDIVVLAHPLSEYRLEVGDVGTVVHRYANGAALEVEFVTGEGDTVAVLSLGMGDVRAMEKQ